MKNLLLFVFFLLLSVEVVDSVVYSWILSVNPVDTEDGKETTKGNKTRGNSTMQHCKKDRHCEWGHYCHKHNGLCRSCRNEEFSRCRRDNMCCDGMECVFGRCRKAMPRGTLNAKCRKDRKCDTGLCCVKVHGQPICKQLLQEGEDCSVPEGGLGYSLNQKCPCAPGLVCKKVKNRHKKRLVTPLDRKMRVCQRL